MANILVLANETIGGKALLDRIIERAGEGDARFFIVVPRTKPRYGNVIYDDAVRSSAQVRVDLACAFARQEGIDAHGRGRRRGPLQRRHGRDRRARDRRGHRLDAPGELVGLDAPRPARAHRAGDRPAGRAHRRRHRQPGPPLRRDARAGQPDRGRARAGARARATCRRGPAALHRRRAAGFGRRQRHRRRPRAPEVAAELARGRRDRRRRHDRRPGPVHRHA